VVACGSDGCDQVAIGNRHSCSWSSVRAVRCVGVGSLPAISHHFSSTWQIWRERPSRYTWQERIGLADEAAEQVWYLLLVRSKHLSLKRESKQCYEHEHEYQKCVHLLTYLVYARVKDYQRMNRQAPVIRVGVDDVHNSGQISLSTRISIGLFSAFFVDNGGRYTIPQWACPFLNSCSIAIDH
jgi:hypothetical protein